MECRRRDKQQASETVAGEGKGRQEEGDGE